MLWQLQLMLSWRSRVPSQVADSGRTSGAQVAVSGGTDVQPC